MSNEDRTLGARLAGELALLNTNGTRTDATLTFKMSGIAGQSFGAFAAPGMQLVLKGLANDFVGKGLSGGELILRGEGRAALQSELHVILGNVAFMVLRAARYLRRDVRVSALRFATPGRWQSLRAWAIMAAST